METISLQPDGDVLVATIDHPVSQVNAVDAALHHDLGGTRNVGSEIGDTHATFAADLSTRSLYYDRIEHHHRPMADLGFRVSTHIESESALRDSDLRCR